MMLMKTQLQAVTGRCRAVCLLAALVAWGAQASAAEHAMSMQADHAHSDHAASGMAGMEHHSMQHGALSASGDEHAAHHAMMHRQAYEQTVHEYRIPDLGLLDEQGRATSMTEQLDTAKPVMLNFIFTTCTTICPVLSATFAQIQEELGSEADSIRMLSVTIDPEQDTPERLRAYAERFQAGSQWRFLTGDAESIVAVQKAFDIYRGSKTNHEPITLLRGPGATSWLRIDGIASAADIIDEYQALVKAEQ
jgi:protein SCO1